MKVSRGVHDIWSIHRDGGAFYTSGYSNVLIIHHDFMNARDTVPALLWRIAVNRNANIVLYPGRNIKNYKGSPLRPFVDAFLRENTRPSYIFTVKVVPTDIISDGTIYIATNDIKDKEHELDAILDEKKSWLYVKNDETSSDPVLKMINKAIIREFALLSSCIVMNESGVANTLPNFLTLLASILKTRAIAIEDKKKSINDWSDIA